MVNTKPKTGHLLIAEPALINDSSFNRSVILLADHNIEGTVGFIMNKPSKYTINDLVPDIKAFFTVYNGGPVEQNNLYYIHNRPNLISNSIEISNGVYWGGDFDMAKTLINNNQIDKNNIKFFLGYTGWDSNQLDSEMKAKSWILAGNTNQKNIIGKSSSQFWKEKLMELGGDYLIWANAPEDPTSN